MRILHTADWHLGRSLHGQSMLDEQAEALDRILEIGVSAGCEALLIAGDIYDRAVPPVTAVSLFDDTITRAVEAGMSVVAISGNHDSSQRLGVYGKILDTSPVSIRGDAGRSWDPVVIDDPSNGGTVSIYPIPYLDPYLDSAAITGETQRLSHQQIMDEVCREIRRHASMSPNPTVVMAHTHLNGADQTDSERSLTMGDTETVNPAVFDGFGYVALGHLHGPQTHGGDRVAYSGSLLPYSFSEQDHTKSVRVVDIAADNTSVVETIPLKVGTPMVTITGEIDALLNNPDWSFAESCKVRVILTDRHLPTQAMRRIKERFDGAVVLRHEPPQEQTRTAETVDASPEPAVESPNGRIIRFWEAQTGNRPDSDQENIIDAALRQSVEQSC